MPQPEASMQPAPYRFDHTVLREYDIRGIYKETLDTQDAYAIGLGFGTMVRRSGGKSVVTCYDGRLSSPILHDALADGLRATGCDVLHIGIGPTPMGYFAAHHLHADAAVVVTGSHNPPSYNGFKFVLNQKPFFGAAIQDIGLMAASADWDVAAQPGKLSDIDVRAAYVQRLLQDLRLGRDLKIAWDAGNGSASDIVTMLTAKMPGTHSVLFADIDGTFPNHHPDPAVEANMADLKRTVLENKCDLGIAFDGDGDRIGIIDEQGHLISPDRLISIFAADVLTRHPGATIIADVKCSSTLFAEIERLGGRPLMWKTGRSLIHDKMMETNAPLGGELSGHIFVADGYYGFDDALYCAIRLLNIISASDKPVSSYLAHLPVWPGTPEMRIDVDEAQKFAMVDALREQLRQEFDGQGYSFSTIDGLRIDGPDGWMVLRASNTQNCIVARIEARNVQILDILKKRLEDALSLAHLSLPDLPSH